MNWFSGCTTPEEIKKHYRMLAMLHHPDRGGDNGIMAEINNQYHAALAACDGHSSFDTEGKQHTYHYNRETEEAILSKINDLLRARMAGVEIWLVGYWVWIRGDTKPHRAQLKKLDCQWNPKRGCWYWQPFKKYRHRSSPLSFEGLADKYGARVFVSKDDDMAAA